MNPRRLQGWALIVSAVLLIYSLVESYFFSGLGDSNSKPYAIRLIITSIIFIFGLPSIYSAQPQIGRWGQIGLILMAIPPLVELGESLAQFAWDLGYLNWLYLLLSLPYLLLSSSFPPPILVFYLGHVIVGWLTIQTLVFPKWSGWSLITYGMLTIAPAFVWFILPEALSSLIYGIVPLVGALALAGYGWHIVKHQTAL